MKLRIKALEVVEIFDEVSDSLDILMIGLIDIFIVFNKLVVELGIVSGFLVDVLGVIDFIYTIFNIFDIFIILCLY